MPRLPSIRLMILMLALTLAYIYTLNIIVPNRNARLEVHDQIVASTAPAPYSNRLLVPTMTNWVMEITGRDSFSYVYAAYCLLAITFSLFMMYIFWRIWFSPELAFAGIVAFSFSYVISMHYHYYQPWSHLEPGLIAMTLWSIRRKNSAFLIGILLLILNRYCGFPPGQTISNAWRIGTADLAGTVAAHVLFWHLIGPCALIGYKRSPLFLRWSGLYVIPLLVAFFLFARWCEVRPLLSTMPVVIPYALSNWRRQSGDWPWKP